MQHSNPSKKHAQLRQKFYPREVKNMESETWPDNPLSQRHTFRAALPKANFDDPIVLESLKHGIQLTLNWQADATSEPQVLYAHFPKQLAIHFSEKWRNLFCYIPGLTARETVDQHPKTITIIGSKIEFHQTILQWMLDSAGGYGLKPWTEYEFSDKPFYRYFYLRRCAQIVGCSFLEDEFHLRMQALSHKRIHSDDVSAVYLEVDRSSKMATHLVEHVASFFVEKGPYHHIGPYMRLRQAIPDFDNAIIARIGFRYVRDPELAGAWNARTLAKEEVMGETVLASLEVDKAAKKEIAVSAKIEEKSVDEKDDKDGAENDDDGNDEEQADDKGKKKAVVGVDAFEQAMNEASKVKDKNARRREKKRLAKLASEAAAE